MRVANNGSQTMPLLIPFHCPTLAADAALAVSTIRRNSSVTVRCATEDEWQAFVDAMRQAPEWGEIVLHFVRKEINPG